MGIKQIFLIFYLFTAVLEDFHSRRIPNWWIVFGLGIGVLSVFVEEKNSYLYYAAGCLLPFFLLFLFYCVKVIGAGDIKLFMVTGLFLGVKEVLYVMLCSFLIGGVYALICLIRRKSFKRRFTYLFHYVKRVVKSGRPEAYVEGAWNREMVLYFSPCILLGCLPVIGGVL